MQNENEAPKKENISESLKKYKETINSKSKTSEAYMNPQISEKVSTDNIPSMPMQTYNPSQFEANMAKETDPDLMMSYEVVPFPSKGLHYKNGISEANVEYMTSIDEDLLTTPSLIENGTVLDILLKRKTKMHGLEVSELLPGDKNAVVLFLRTSSYGPSYNVNVTDPRTGNIFKSTVDLTKLRYKEVSELPNNNGHYNVFIPMRKKNITFKLISSGDETLLLKKAKALQDAYGTEFSEFNTMKLKSQIVSVDEKTDRSYIDRFVNAMPALDAYTIRKKILDVSPDVDMKYEFVANDGFKFFANLEVGIDFFFPNT